MPQFSNCLNDVVIESLRCAFCSKDLDPLSISQREAHYELHFSNDFGGSQTVSIKVDLNTEPPAPPKKDFRAAYTKNGTPQKRCMLLAKETDVFWYPDQANLPPSSCTPGIIHLLRKGLLKLHGRGNLRRAVLCTDKAVHVHREAWDANWGCGYRNFLMLCATLMCQTQQPLYFPLLDSPLPPSIRNLQSWIESAWKQGFDVEGQKELKKLVGTRKWIGTADLWVAFASRGIPAELVDFDLRNSTKGPESVVDWVVNYFSPQPRVIEKPLNAFESLKVFPITNTNKMPLILQHDGHSRTIVGYQVDKNGATSLLVFDPAHRPTEDQRRAALCEFEHLKMTSENGLLEPMGGSSNLKRKRSLEISRQDNKASRVDGSSSNVQKTSPLKVLSSKNGFSRSDHSGKDLDLFALVKKYSIEIKNLSKKKQYQILYFPLRAPLTEYEKTKRKVVTSTKIS
ncbi:unnamed protein product [Cyclocybe aegerita]|uniref:UFSP1/2/DUB catalytic domain-containing protein n=1 Tax=Cyclocybe aegerita TaxID=1973307 RepID=A0A8S0W9Q3_CYCAE|nr:unnamed protein product [Cyclocybe aegerita]